MSGDRKVSHEKFTAAAATTLSAITIFIFFLIVFFCLPGCTRTEKSHFYALYPLTRFSPAVLNADTTDVSIGIGPVVIPEYLNRPQIVTRFSQYEIEISDFNRWADSLEESVPRVLAENLSALLSTDLVYTYPWGEKNPDYELRMEIIQFDASIPGNIELMARWTLIKDGAETRINRRKYYDKKPIAGQGYSGMASAMSLVLYDMSREIARTIIQASLDEDPAR